MCIDKEHMIIASSHANARHLGTNYQIVSVLGSFASAAEAAASRLAQNLAPLNDTKSDPAAQHSPKHAVLELPCSQQSTVSRAYPLGAEVRGKYTLTLVLLRHLSNLLLSLLITTPIPKMQQLFR